MPPNVTTLSLDEPLGARDGSFFAIRDQVWRHSYFILAAGQTSNRAWQQIAAHQVGTATSDNFQDVKGIAITMAHGLNLAMQEQIKSLQNNLALITQIDQQARCPEMEGTA